MAVRLSALRPGHILPPGTFLVLISLRDWVDPRAIVHLERLSQLKNPANWCYISTIFKMESAQIQHHASISCRSFRWEYLPPSRYYRPTKAKTSPLRGSTGMVGMPISVLQSTLGTQSFNRQSGIVTGNTAFWYLNAFCSGRFSWNFVILSRVGWYAWWKWWVLVWMIGFIITSVTHSLLLTFKYSAIADLHTHWSSPGTTIKTHSH
jgi:hypothetical protein